MLFDKFIIFNFILYKGKIKNKIKEIIILICSLFLYSSINTQIIKNISSDKQENINNRI